MEEFTFEGLLKDAIFLSDKENGIPHFCVEPEDKKNFWKNLTKYSASKPISQALNAIMLGRSFEEAMERFLRNLSDKIPREEEEKLKEFIEGVKNILKKYYELRKKSVNDFLKAKNSLTSAIFILTRYPSLKEVFND